MELGGLEIIEVETGTDELGAAQPLGAKAGFSGPAGHGLLAVPCVLCLSSVGPVVRP